MVEVLKEFSSDPTEEQRPPPAYKEGPGVSPIILAETTTTTEVVTTTTRTTRLFSIPLLRRRTSPVLSLPLPRISALDADQHGAIPSVEARRTSFPLDKEKDLPPIPVEEPEVMKGSYSSKADSCIVPQAVESYICNGISTSQHIACPTPRPRISSEGSPSALALARASLGLGLPHVMPSAPTPLSSEVNTIPFGRCTPSPDTRNSHPPPTVRRSKSFRFRHNSSSPASSAVQESVPRRMRGTSISGMPSAAAPNGKGKEKEMDQSEVDSPARTLSRRPSRFSVKKKTAPELPPASRASSKTGRDRAPSLPYIPLTPMDFSIPLDLSVYCISQPPLVQSGRYPERNSPPPPLPFGSNSGDLNQDKTHTLHASIPSLTPRRSMTISRPSHSRTRSFSSPPADPISIPPRRDSPAPHPPAPTRERTQTNPPPPLLQRLSINLFASPGLSNTSRSPVSPSPSPALGSNHPNRQIIQKRPTKAPKPKLEDESPEVFLRRVLAAVSKAEVAGVLASRGDPFYIQTLRLYLEKFDFCDDPLDVALRKLLMDVGLPSETQQIDRVMEAFASRYLQCNPNLFSSDDHPYILAFSLIMLHTDAFNKSNKRKMTKADYIKNTRLPGVAPEVLDCFYDNIVFAPFIFIEDPFDVNGQRGLVAEGSSASISIMGTPPINGRTSSVTLLGKGTKIDPYYLITNNLLGPLRLDVEEWVPLENPFSYVGTGGPWDEDELQLAFAKARVIEVGSVENARSGTTFFSLGAGMAAQGASQDVVLDSKEIWTLKVAKAGTLNRKDDVLEGGKKASNRKWRPWSVVLTGSQLLFFRDPTWAHAFLAQAQVERLDGQVVVSQSSLFKPDELLSVKDAVAVYDKAYNKYTHTFRFVMPGSRQFLLQASAEEELNEWISRINYASAFKSAGVRMRALGMSGEAVELTGVAAANSHLNGIEILRRDSRRSHSWDGACQSKESCVPSPSPEPLGSSRLGPPTNRSNVELDVAVAPEIEGADQFQATFDQVKAELATYRFTSSDDFLSSTSKGRHCSTLPDPCIVESEHTGLPSRSQILRLKTDDLEARIAAAQTQLDSDMRLVRNIATLTPFRKSTRDRLQTALQDVAKRIAQVRLELARLTCHRDVLSDDLAAEGRDWHHTKTMALRAATETLQNRGASIIPRMTLSSPEDINGGASPGSRSLEVGAQRPGSACESYYSALEYGSGWLTPSSDTETSSLGDAQCGVDSPCTSSSAGSTMVLRGGPADANVGLGRSISRIPSTNDGTHKDEAIDNASESPDEQAEQWNETRCAHRVSLVRMPSDLRMSTVLGLRSAV